MNSPHFGLGLHAAKDRQADAKMLVLRHEDIDCGKMRVSAQIRAALEIGFAHWQDLEEFDFESEFERWIDVTSPMEFRREFSLQTMRFMASLKNGHTAFNDRWLWQTHGHPLGFHANCIDGDWVVTKSNVPNLEPGDVLYTLDEEPMSSVSARLRPYISASTHWAQSHALFSRHFLFPEKFTLETSKGKLIGIERGAWRLNQPQEPTLTDAGIPLLRIPSFSDAAYEDAALKFVQDNRNEAALIIDIRGNGGGDTPLKLLRALMDRPFTTWREEIPTHSGLHYVFKDRPESLRFEPEVEEPSSETFKGRLAIIADEGTGSAAEDFLAPFKHNGRATIVGRTTSGSSGQPFVRDFGNGMVLVVGSKREYFPDGSRFEGVGVAPDVEVVLRPQHLEEGTDADLDAAKSALM